MSGKCCGRTMFALGCRFVNEAVRVCLGEWRRCLTLFYSERDLPFVAI